MEKEISQLEAISARLLGEYEAVREENRKLHARLDSLEAENTRLRDKLAQGIARVESLVARLPEQEDA